MGSHAFVFMCVTAPVSHGVTTEKSVTMAEKVTQTIPLVDEWRKWMNENEELQLTASTIDTYSNNYLPNLLKRVLIAYPSFEHDLFSMLGSNNPWEAVRFLSQMLGLWKEQQSNIAGSRPLSPKTISDYASALSCFIEFLIDIITNGQLSILLGMGGIPKSAGIKSFVTKLPIVAHQIYTRKELRQSFKARLGSQDRFPVTGVYFPIRLIKKIISSQSGGSLWSRKWLARYVDGIRILAKNAIYRVGEIDSLDIFGREVYIDGKADRVFTECASVGRPTPDYMEASCLADVSINHDIPIAIELAAGGWHALDDIKKMVDTWYSKNHPQSKNIKQGDANAIAQGVYADFQKLLPAERQSLIEGLKKDLNRIAVSPLTLMERGENSSKNNKL